MESNFRPRSGSSIFFVTFVACIVVVSHQTFGVAGSKSGKVVAFFQKTCSTWGPSSNPCQQFCTDIKSGGFYCECQEGYSLNKDGMTCSKVPEFPASPLDTSNVQEGGDNDASSSNQVGAQQRDHSSSGANYNENGEVVISDHDVVHLKSIDLTQGLPRLESSAHSRRLGSDRMLILDQQMYNIPEGGARNDFDDINFNTLAIPEGGDHNEESVDSSKSKNEVKVPPSQGDLQPILNEDITCDGVVCANNGSCVINKNSASCDCPFGTAGHYCERLIEVKYPRFEGTGYLALPVLRNAHKEFRLSLEFKPESLNGLLLFSGELASAKSDFFSLALHEGIVIVRFDCGTGIAELRTPNQVNPGGWNQVVVSRIDNRGVVQLNGGQEVEGVSQGYYTRITFRLNLYLGGYSNMESISSRVGTSERFVGCIQELAINGHTYDFRTKGLVGESEFGSNVGECSEGVCNNIVCEKGGSCVARSADQPVCLCPLGFHGDSCEKDSPVHVPHFSGHSHLEFPGLQRSVLSFTEIEIVFKPSSPDGALLYNGFSRDRKGDFISLALNEGHLEFRFDLGTGPAVIRSYEPLQLNQWHLVRASRTGLMGRLEIDGQPQVSGQSLGAFTQLTLLDGLYLGGHPNFDHTSKHANITRSFTGCLQKVVINKKSIDLLKDNGNGVNISPCSHPCAGSPCMNGGECKPRRDTYTCYCPLGYSNTNCEDEQLKLPSKPMFTGESFLMYKDKEIIKRVSGSAMDVQMYIRPKGRDGLLFWSGEDFSSKSARDYVALGFQEGSLQLRYNLGSGDALIGFNDSRLFDGGWHFIRAQRDKQNAYMEIDGKEIVEGSSPGGYTSLNTNKIVYLGGMQDIFEKTDGKFSTGYTGCIRGMRLGTDFDVKLIQQSHSGRNIVQCRKKLFL